MKFRVGQKVVFVDDSGQPNPRWAGVSYPALGAVYTVRKVYVSRDDDVTVCILVNEISNPTGPRGHECGYRASRFRPAIDRPTDISIFTKMLTNTRVNETA